MSNYHALPASGHHAAWSTWDHRAASTVKLRWENEAWTAETTLEQDNAVLVLRLSALWVVQQVLLFRDLDEPDLWLGTDTHGRWGEINGAHRPDLDGCIDVDIAGSPFTNSIIIHRTPLHIGHTIDLPVMAIDVDTLGVVTHPHRYTRTGHDTWNYTSLVQNTNVDVTVDEFGFVIDEPNAYRRIAHNP